MTPSNIMRLLRVSAKTLSRSFELSIAGRIRGLGDGEGAAATADQALEIARNSDRVSTLMYVLFFISPLHLLMGNYATAAAQAQELLALAEEKVASFWIERATFVRGCILGFNSQTQ